MGRREKKWWERKGVNIGGNWGCKPQELPPAGEGLFFEKNLQLSSKIDQFIGDTECIRGITDPGA